MSQRITRYVARNLSSRPTSDYDVEEEALDHYNRALLVAFQADTVLATGKHVMASMARLDRARKSLAPPDDAVLNNLLGQIELEAFNQARAIVSELGLQPPTPEPTIWDM